MKELYFLLFRRLSANPIQKYYLAVFHMLGVLAFLFSTIKHFHRKNKIGIIENLIVTLEQLIECYVSLLYPERLIASRLN